MIWVFDAITMPIRNKVLSFVYAVVLCTIVYVTRFERKSKREERKSKIEKYNLRNGMMERRNDSIKLKP